MNPKTKHAASTSYDNADVRQQRTGGKPAGKRCRALARLLRAGKTERYPLLNKKEFERELQARRGRNF